jgi:uncharacterized OB-fold protein
MSALQKPVPLPDPATRDYWDAASRGELRLPRCTSCSKVHFYPRPACPHCGGTAFDWPRASGAGTIYSFTVVQRAPSPAFEGDVPYVVAIIALDEGPHLMSNVVGVDPSTVRIGQHVEVQFRDAAEGVRVPVFTPA